MPSEPTTSRRFSEETDKAIVRAGELAIKSAILINGGAAVAMLAFIGGLVREDGLTVKQVAGVASSLLWFAGGVGAAVWALALSYFTNFCYVRASLSKKFTLDHPYVIDGENTRRWSCWALAFHVGAAVWAFLSLAAFVVGTIFVYNAVLKLAD